MAEEKPIKQSGMYEDEKQKIAFLENLVKYLYNTKLQVDSENKVISISFTPEELKALVDIEKELMEMRRKIYGIPQK